MWPVYSGVINLSLNYLVNRIERVLHGSLKTSNSVEVYVRYEKKLTLLSLRENMCFCVSLMPCFCIILHAICCGYVCCSGPQLVYICLNNLSWLIAALVYSLEASILWLHWFSCVHVFVVAVFRQVVEMYILRIPNLISYRWIMLSAVKTNSFVFFSCFLSQGSQELLCTATTEIITGGQWFIVMPVCSLVSTTPGFL